MIYSEQILSKSKESNYLWSQASGYVFLAATYHRRALFDSSIFFSEKSIALFPEVRDSVLLGSSHLSIAMCQVSTGQYELGAKNAFESLRIFEGLSEKNEEARKRYLPRVNNIISQVYYYQEDFETTEKYFKKYLELAIAFEDSVLIGSANNNLGAVYSEMKEYDKATFHQTKAVVIQKSLGNKLGYANAIQNIATDMRIKQEFDESLRYYKDALAVYREIENDKGISECLYNLGQLYLGKKSYSKARVYYDRAILVATKNKNPETVLSSIDGLREISERQGSYEEALDHFKSFFALNDSLVNEKNLNKISELQIAYDIEKKDQEIILLNKEKQLQQGFQLSQT